MSKSTLIPVVTSFTKPLRRRATCQCASSLHLPSKAFSTSLSQDDQSELYGNRGRELRHDRKWETTPPRMMAPVRSRPPVYNNDFTVNKDPAKLNMVYNRILGKGGDQMLTDEVKWLAVTHKSFDHGRRGYNDRLAFLGRRLVELQTSLALIHEASGTETSPQPDQYGREPFVHPALQGIDSFKKSWKGIISEKVKLARLAQSYGLDGVLRWKPRKVTNLEGAGQQLVLVQALYAIVGAVALQRGGDVANTIVKERIFDPLGFRISM